MTTGGRGPVGAGHTNGAPQIRSVAFGMTKRRGPWQGKGGCWRKGRCCRKGRQKAQNTILVESFQLRVHDGHFYASPRDAPKINLFDLDHFSVNLLTFVRQTRGFLTRPSSIAASNTTLLWNAIGVFLQTKCSTSVLVARPGDVSAIGTQNVYPGIVGCFKGF